MKSLPPLYFMKAEKELDDPEITSKAIVKLLRERGVHNVEEYNCKGHNHVSTPLSLSTGEGEEWGYEVVRWIKTH